jgi:release factor glutamine methyltransferase
MMNKAGGKAVGELFEDLIFRLGKISDTPGLDAQGLLSHVMVRPPAWVMAHPETCLGRSRVDTLENLVARLEKGEPLPYVLGNWEFFGLGFEVTPDVLVPRPETELLVERALAWLGGRELQNGECRVLDVGTGCGCIAISLAVNVPRIRMTATDISPAALVVARRNAEKWHVSDRITFLQADLIPDAQVMEPFFLIIANPPYIPTRTLHRLPIYGREPTLALDGGSDGLNLIRRILAKAPERLIPGGLLLMEIEASQGPAALSLACDLFAEAEIHLHKDLAGRDRILEVQV